MAIKQDTNKSGTTIKAVNPGNQYPAKNHDINSKKINYPKCITIFHQ